MFKLVWGALFGNPLYTLLGFGAVMLVSNGYVGIKAYQFGADREWVNCQVRINKINEKIAAANLEIEKQAKQHADAIIKIEQEREAETAAADAAERGASERIKSYAIQLGLRTDKCLPSADDIKRVQ